MGKVRRFWRVPGAEGRRGKEAGQTALGVAGFSGLRFSDGCGFHVLFRPAHGLHAGSAWAFASRDGGTRPAASAGAGAVCHAGVELFPVGMSACALSLFWLSRILRPDGRPDRGHGPQNVQPQLYAKPWKREHFSAGRLVSVRGCRTISSPSTTRWGILLATRF